MPFASDAVHSRPLRAAAAACSLPKRCALLDSLRGLALSSMLLYHACWDAVYLFGAALPWLHGTAAYLWQQSICWSFILLSGFCWPLGRRPLRRGAHTLLAGALVSAVTAAILPDNPVRFGILTLLGSCTLLLRLLDKPLRQCAPAAGLCVSAALFALTRNLSRGALGFEAWEFAPLPAALYRNCATAYLGFPPPSFYSVDYFPLFPWCFLFLCGYFASRTAVARRFLRRALPPGPKPLQFLGRHSLAVYLLHQPILYPLLQLALA